MRAPVAAAAALLVAIPAVAHPVLDEGRRAPTGWCYPDHELRRVWWVAPPAPRLQRIGDRPAVDFTVYNYQGARATADTGQAWGGALLQFSLELPDPGGSLAAARRVLGAAAELRPLPAATIEAEVVFAGVNSTRQATAAAVEGGAAAEGGAWRERSFSLGLTPEEVAAVHDAWRAGAVILSVNLAVSVYGFPSRPEQDGAAPELLPVVVDSVPVTVDASRHPEVFRVLELDATMPLGYTALELGCSELAEGSGLADLVRVVAVVEAEAVNGDRVTERAQFARSGPPTRAVRFDRAVRLDPGYLLRVVRVYASGRSEEGPPRRVEVWQGFVDICSAAAGSRVELDPRLYY